MWTLFLACSSPPPDPTPVEVAPPGHEHREGHAEHPHAHEGGAHHRFDDAERWAAVFDDPERDAWQKPTEVVSALSLAPGMTVADIGAGTGYFNPHLATAVGPEGHVIAIDIEPNLVAHMTARAAKDGTPQVVARLATADDPALQPEEADRVLIVDTYHHITERPAYFAKVHAGTKAGGKLVVVDFKKEETPMGPPVSERMPPAQVKAELQLAGWTFERMVDGLPYQYVLVFTR